MWEKEGEKKEERVGVTDPVGGSLFKEQGCPRLKPRAEDPIRVSHVSRIQL